MIRFYAENKADAVELTTDREVPEGAAWHQVGLANPLGDAGSGIIEVDDGTGYRTYAVVDLTKTDRVPFCMVLDAKGIRITPDRAMTICYKAQPVGML